MQLAGVGTDVNVAEGYPRQRLTETQQRIVDRFAELMAEALGTSWPELERRAHAAFFDALGQHSAPIGTGRIISYYTSSQGIDVVARCLAETVGNVGVVNPTLDCIPALLRARGLRLVPIGERRLVARDPLAGLDPQLGALFIANPNNPTGTHLDERRLRALAEACAERDVVLVIDQCFRAFDARTHYDTYACLDKTGVEYAVIEDTGKLWPLAGLKLGFVSTSVRTRLPIGGVSADVLLTPSPFVARLVEELALDMASGGLDQMHQLIALNRSLIREALDGCEAAVAADGGSRVSVSRVRLADRNATLMWGRLLQRGIHTVPCRPFYWARPSEGERFLRIALSRDPEDVERAALAVRDLVAVGAPA